MMRISEIPSDHYTPAKHLASHGFSYRELKDASKTGGGITPMAEPENAPGVLPGAEYAVVLR